jgi:hypothetical protein
MPPEPSHDTVRAPINATFADYVATLPLWERDLLAHATEDHCPDSSLYGLLQQTNINILVASDGGHNDDYGSFAWVIGTNHEVIWECEGIARGWGRGKSYRAVGYGRMFLLFLTRQAGT